LTVVSNAMHQPTSLTTLVFISTCCQI